MVLCKCKWLRLVRDVIGFKACIRSTIFIAIMIELIFLHLDKDQKGVQDFTGAIFFTSANQLFSAANPKFISVPLEIPLFYLFFPATFLPPCYFTAGFGSNDAEGIFSFFLIICLLSSCATGIGYMVSCLAKRVDVASILGIRFILPFLLVGTFFLNSDSTPDNFIWLQQISPIKCPFPALMRETYHWGEGDDDVRRSSICGGIANSGGTKRHR
ncbi:hypothetical protein Gpo141_00013041 [Globisporangium polare]